MDLIQEEKEKNIEQFADRILAGKLKKMEKMKGKILKKNQAEAGLIPEFKTAKMTREAMFKFKAQVNGS